MDMDERTFNSAAKERNARKTVARKTVALRLEGCFSFAGTSDAPRPSDEGGIKEL
jgi:hypothetical protein